MISIPYEAAVHRYAMLKMREEGIRADIICRQGGGRDIVPATLNFGRQSHRVYRIDGWIVEQYPTILALYRIPGQENLCTQLDISFRRPVGVDFVLCDGAKKALRREKDLRITGIRLDSGIVLQNVTQDDAAVPDSPGAATELEQLRRQCREQADELNRLQTENARLKEQNAGLLDGRLDGQMEEMRRRQDGLTQEVSGKQSQLEVLEAQRDMMLAQKEELERRTQEVQGEIGHLRLSIEDLRRCVQEYEQHRVEALSRNQLVEIDAEATMNALTGSFEELLCTQDAMALLDQADVMDSLQKARELIGDAQKTLESLIRTREELDRKIHQSLRRAAPKGEQ